MLHFVDVGSIR